MSTPGTTTPGRSAEPDRRPEMIELAEHLGLREEAESLRGDLRTEQFLPRLQRALELAGLPASTGPGNPGIVFTPVGDFGVGFPAGSVAVEWRVGSALEALYDESETGDPADRLVRTVTGGIDNALRQILRQCGLRILTDTQFTGVIVAGLAAVDGADTLGL